jgi:hypothetical protein
MIFEKVFFSVEVPPLPLFMEMVPSAHLIYDRWPETGSDKFNHLPTIYLVYIYTLYQFYLSTKDIFFYFFVFFCNIFLDFLLKIISQCLCLSFF